jgi:5-methylcytosine-specific restriction endonuclease McrA
MASYYPQTCRGQTQSGGRCHNKPSAGSHYCHMHSSGSRYISEKTREDVFDACGGVCFHCGKRLTFANRSEGRGVWEPDHLRPHSQGGSNSSSNLVASCKDCNRSRSDQPVRQFGDGVRRCEGFKRDGSRCTHQVAPGNYKYCGKHAGH